MSPIYFEHGEPTQIEVDGTCYDRIKYGSESERWRASRSGDGYQCPSCAGSFSELHAINCPLEQCPACQGQFISCDCEKTLVTITEE